MANKVGNFITFSIDEKWSNEKVEKVEKVQSSNNFVGAFKSSAKVSVAICQPDYNLVCFSFI